MCYLAEARPALLAGHAEALFITDYGEPLKGEPLTPECVADKVKRYMGFAGIANPIDVSNAITRY